uniref:Putative secreted protein n=1 Tax=Anopheles darlingi TaxID=43151 RepID=A0A2M4DCL7_ANODA
MRSMLSLLFALSLSLTLSLFTVPSVCAALSAGGRSSSCMRVNIPWHHNTLFPCSERTAQPTIQTLSVRSTNSLPLWCIGGDVYVALYLSPPDGSVCVRVSITCCVRSSYSYCSSSSFSTTSVRTPLHL